MEWNLPIFWVIVKYINSAAIIYPSANSSVHTHTLKPDMSFNPSVVKWKSLLICIQSFSSSADSSVNCWSPRGGEEWAASCSTGCIYRHNKDGLLSLRLWHWEVMNKVFHKKKIFMFVLLLLFLSAGQCPKPMTSRDVVSLRSWQVKDDEYVIVNFSVKHPVRRLLHTLPCTKQRLSLNVPFLNLFVF